MANGAAPIEILFQELVLTFFYFLASCLIKVSITISHPNHRSPGRAISKTRPDSSRWTKSHSNVWPVPARTARETNRRYRLLL